ncbi:hypothetical protein [Serinicoccus sp. CNJ-927]|uniref:hypothetical protein n=1 Tax=Serinicoccus sp. CNJ-927 TaxID=1904970 RepID=UPI001EDA7525|nr:hypothetical protein [Serinicoccus sp. CNJ-927]
MRGINWKAAAVFFFLAAALYAAGMLMFGEPLLLSILGGVVWAAFFVPAMLWLGMKMNQRMMARRPGAAGSRVHEPGDDGEETVISHDHATPIVVGRREGGGFYRRTVLVAGVEPAVAAAQLEKSSSWRVHGSGAAEVVTLRRGSRAWLRIMGAWEWGPKSRDRWPYLALLARDCETGATEVTVTDNFGRWINLHSSGSSVLSHVAAYGDELLDHIEDSLKSVGRST